MNDLSRRHLLAGAAAAGAAFALTPLGALTARAAVPPAAAQAPGFYRYKVGVYEGGFNRSSQHFSKGGCDEEVQAALGSVCASNFASARPASRGPAREL